MLFNGECVQLPCMAASLQAQFSRTHGCVSGDSCYLRGNERQHLVLSKLVSREISCHRWVLLCFAVAEIDAVADHHWTGGVIINWWEFLRSDHLAVSPLSDHETPWWSVLIALTSCLCSNVCFLVSHLRADHPSWLNERCSAVVCFTQCTKMKCFIKCCPHQRLHFSFPVMPNRTECMSAWARPIPCLVYTAVIFQLKALSALRLSRLLTFEILSSYWSSPTCVNVINQYSILCIPVYWRELDQDNFQIEARSVTFLAPTKPLY